MPSMKALKRRITSVGTTKKIMKAMDMVAASKLRLARARLNTARAFAHEARKMISLPAHDDSASQCLFIRPRKIAHTAYVVITSDRGLCGSLNTALAEKTLAHINAHGDAQIIAVGLKGQEYFRQRGKHILTSYPGISETAFYEDAEMIAVSLTALYKSGKVDEAYLAYTRFDSALTHVPCIERILPLSMSDDAPENTAEMRYEPEARTFIDQAAPMYLNACIFAAMVESSACEQAARMISMDSAVSSASDILDGLTRAYNHRRQTIITQEISEIVGSANTVK